MVALGFLLTFICTLDDERLITPGWQLLREFHLATRDGLQGKARQLRPLLHGGFFSWLMHGGRESETAEPFPPWHLPKAGSCHGLPPPPP